jgi:phosphoribosylformylglycinamidine cyclo-ligase
MTLSLSYKKSGVDIDAGDALVDRIAPLAKKTRRRELISGIGGFAGLFRVDTKKYKHPVLVASTDGVGTKLKLALDVGHIDDLGQDLVAMCVNDLICCGAEPLFFLDYFATGSLNVKQGTMIIQSIARSLKSINCTLLGGETAEMPGLYKKGDFDIAGFTVGVVDRKKIIDGHNVKSGDVLIGLRSSGIHSNGYSLVRKIIDHKKLNLQRQYKGLDRPLGQILLKPTKLYVNPVLDLIKKFNIHAMAHITGGGLFENLPRVLPKKTRPFIDKKKIAVPKVFRFLQAQGNVPEDEMWRVFNMGIGFVLVVAKKDAEKILLALKKMKCAASVIGEIK